MMNRVMLNIVLFVVSFLIIVGGVIGTGVVSTMTIVVEIKIVILIL